MKPSLALALIFTLSLLPAQSQAAPPLASGLDPANFDASVRPQDDLFRAVNGTWLAKTEIPADRADYGAFTALAEQAEKDVSAILEECAKDKDAAAGSERQKVGNLYAAFMDADRAEQLGIEPIAGTLASIDQIATKADLVRRVGRVVARRGLRPLRRTCRPRCQAFRSLHHPPVPGGPGASRPRLLPGCQVQRQAGGLRRPRREDAPASQDRRRQASGRRDRGPRDASCDGPMVEDGQPRQRQDVQQEDPRRTGPTRARLRLESVPRRPRRRRRQRVYRRPTVLLHGRREADRRRALGNLAGVAEMARGPALRQRAEQGTGRRELRLLRHDAARHPAESPPLEAGRRDRPGESRRGGGQALRPPAFLAGRQGADGHNGQERHRLLSPGISERRLDESPDQGEGPGQARHLQSEDRLSEAAGATTPRCGSLATTWWATCVAPRPSSGTATSPSSASRWTATSGS